MEFSQANHIIKLCLQGMEREEKGLVEEAGTLFLQAWNQAGDNFEKFTAAYYVARVQKDFADKLHWYQTALQFGLKVNSNTVSTAFPSLYSNIAALYEAAGDVDNAKKNKELAASFMDQLPDKGPFYHGMRADLKTGDMLRPGGFSNYQPELAMNHIYFTALANGAGLAAALAKGDGMERVYVVEPTGIFENDPNVTDKKFPGNPTRSYRSRQPLKIVGEINDWVRQTPEDIQKWREKLANTQGKIIN